MLLPNKNDDLSFEELGVIHDQCGPVAKAWFNEELVERAKPLFDETGRLIPPKGFPRFDCDPDKKFNFEKPKKIDYTERLERFFKFLQVAKSQRITVGEFEDRSETAKYRIDMNPGLSNLNHGIALPFFIPKIGKFTDIGKVIEEKFVPAVEIAYLEAFPQRTFNNYNKGELLGNVNVAQVNRQLKLFEKLATGNVVGILYTSCLQGYSVKGQREAIDRLPGELILSGIEILAGYIGYAEILARDWKTPVLEMSGLSVGSSSFPFFWADNAGLGFDRGDQFVPGSGHVSGCVSVLGQ